MELQKSALTLTAIRKHAAALVTAWALKLNHVCRNETALCGRSAVNERALMPSRVPYVCVEDGWGGRA